LIERIVRQFSLSLFKEVNIFISLNKEVIPDIHYFFEYKNKKDLHGGFYL